MAKGQYVHIERFMVDDLGLSGNELITYAIVHGFSQDGESWFTGSAAYIAGWCGCRKQAALANLSKLVEKGLIEKREHVTNGVHLCDYRAVVTEHESVPPVRKTYRGGTENVPGGGTKSVPHTIEVDTLEDTIEGEGARASSADELAGIYNEACPSLPKCRAVTDKRRRSARTLLKTFTVEDFREICRKAQDSSFMRGENDRGWRADFDFLVSERGAAATLEGKYDDRAKAASASERGIRYTIDPASVPDEWNFS